MSGEMSGNTQAAPAADMETTLMTEAMYSLFLMSRDSKLRRLEAETVAAFLEAPPGLLGPRLMKPASTSTAAVPSGLETKADSVPSGLETKADSEDTISTASFGEAGSEREVSDGAWDLDPSAAKRQGAVLQEAEACVFDEPMETSQMGWCHDSAEQVPVEGYFVSGWEAYALPLSEDLLGLLSSRRGKQRLRAVQTQSGVELQLDEAWRLLHLFGPRAAIVEALRFLELMEGFTVPLPTALWTELLRCRNLEVDQAQLSLARVQEILGRRVHIERESLALRVFAPRSELPLAAEAVRALAALCTKQSVDLPDDCDWNVIKALQTSEKVTLKVEGKRVELIGRSVAVAEAAEELRRQLQRPSAEEPAKEEAAPMLLGAGMRSKKGIEPQRVALKRLPPGLSVPEAMNPGQPGSAVPTSDQVCYVRRDERTDAELRFC